MSTPLVITSGILEDSVLQRTLQDVSGEVTVQGQSSLETSGPILVSVFRREAALPDWLDREAGIAREGMWFAKLQGIPTGGPYSITFRLQGDSNTSTHVRGILVGDLWILAGQSNMEGVGNLEDVEPPSPYVHVLDMARRWHIAEEPLHWLCDSPDPCHSEATGAEQERIAREARTTRTKGAGLGLAFANAMHKASGVPIGLIACAHGGTSMQQWNPQFKDQGGRSLYGSMLLSLRAVGNRVRGLLWYQGESDANPQDATQFRERFTQLVENVRTDTGDANLPFYSVQIGRFVVPPGSDPTGWNAIQEHQRTLADEIPNTAVVAGIDLELDDQIHIGVHGLKRIGRRLAHIALHGMAGDTDQPSGPRLRSVTVEGANRDMLRVSYDGVARTGFMPSVRVTGFSVRTADRLDTNSIYKAVVDPARPSDILLSLGGPPEEGLSLWYGHGFDPTCSLTDADDMAAPVFGPVAV